MPGVVPVDGGVWEDVMLLLGDILDILTIGARGNY